MFILVYGRSSRSNSLHVLAGDKFHYKKSLNVGDSLELLPLSTLFTLLSRLMDFLSDIVSIDNQNVGVLCDWLLD